MVLLLLFPNADWLLLAETDKDRRRATLLHVVENLEGLSDADEK